MFSFEFRDAFDFRLSPRVVPCLLISGRRWLEPRVEWPWGFLVVIKEFEEVIN
jgi:hypothetical protein